MTASSDMPGDSSAFAAERDVGVKGPGDRGADDMQSMDAVRYGDRATVTADDAAPPTRTFPTMSGGDSRRAIRISFCMIGSTWMIGAQRPRRARQGETENRAVRPRVWDATSTGLPLSSNRTAGAFPSTSRNGGLP